MPARGIPSFPRRSGHPPALRGLGLTVFFLALSVLAGAQTQPQPTSSPADLPSAPQPQSVPQSRSQSQPKPQPPAPCKAKLRPQPATPSGSAPNASQAAPSTPAPCPSSKPAVINWFARFLNGPEVKPLTPREKARLAVRNLLDPFNAITILGQSGIAVASDPHSPYGPGMPGFARNVGVSFTQDMTGEFFGTFLIPSIVHQDPHYHRMPQASIPRRFGHAILQVVWTRGDNGRGMLNYSNLVGYGIEDEISNLYVPGIASNAPATASRYAIGLATAPIDNFITEFLPDVARHIHVRVVLVQRIINQVSKTEGGSSP